ncbi:Protein N-acetyltransferase, RimJ/RimL family [Cribrihabitans marinus]|uniref:Protein N-acetyltransferase, RimJ/RimL family n=1 Tax=Cribrihabitans marinus TaxID=1227549 RepID=A0A1H7D1K9_9RHOB|nr:GNAT family N-acetyltransferase [Cribrihabitans marinus]GGH37085.1 acetyltransferase [Cribrihabitans marinus]SEJ94697.1 Protein N-acetyltransferase, RimJ/RimL family [Cribrihabitans marinus]
MTAVLRDIPVIATDRLVLRGPLESDFAAHAAFYTSPRSHLVGGPADRFQAWRIFLSGLGHWALRGYGMWMVTERDGGQPVGRVGFINGLDWDEPELGWHLYDGYEGKGYAYEAACAARDHGARHFGIAAPISYIVPENARSLALAERLGASFERDGTVVGTPCQVWRHPRAGAA